MRLAPASAAKTPPERVVELRPPSTLLAVVEGPLRSARALRRDLRVLGADLAVRDGHVILAGEALALRPRAARQLRALTGGRSELLVRVEGMEVRAILSASFAPLDDLDVFSRVARAIDGLGWRHDLVARFVAETDASTVVRLTLRSSRVEVRSGDEFERGVEVGNGECGQRAFTLTPITWRAGCFNFSRSASPPTLRVVHSRAVHRLDHDLSKHIAHALDAAGSLLNGWRSSPKFDDANAITDAAKARSLAGRIAAERRAQEMVER